MRTRIICFAIGVVGILILSGCAPRYQPRPSYTPPDSHMGRMCVANCQNSKNQCKQIRQMQRNQSRMQIDQCEKNAQINYRNCVNAGNVGCYRADCSYLQNSVMTSDCQGDYDVCYQNCGGRIDWREVCVANCS